ncbi:MAG: pyrimidine utilization protein D [Alphaproteobacteria bacterium]|nr:pyrimidine utilization protein D [Alphaproteobacteria bacterium]MBV9371534.1 pyrimidine utilization protein D [Alphaproteobacteria bacterium]MBV9902724.1 pyrimidine utilization protein D [Alphaproteobacteria bacterium]
MPQAAGLWYEWHGPEAGEVLILSAGLGGTGSYWTPNLPALAETYRVLVYDQLGTGRSRGALPPELSVEAMADDLLGLINALGLVGVTLIGHAAGAAIALALTLKAPRLIDRIVAVNAWASPDPHFIRCFETRLTLLDDSVEAYLHAQPIFLYPARWSSAHDAELRAEASHQLLSFQGEENITARIMALCRFDVAARLGRISAPTLVIAAEDDMLVPASCSERLAAGLPNATHVSMTGGHACNVTDPGTFDRLVLEFLRS